MKSPKRFPVPIESPTMMRTPTIITAMASKRGGPRALLQEDPGEQGRKHGGEGEDEDEVGGRGVVDAGDEGDRAEAVERGDRKAGRPGMSCGAFGVSERQTAQMTSAARKVMPVRSIRIDQASPSASRISGMSKVSARPPMAVMSRPLAWLVSDG